MITSINIQKKTLDFLRDLAINNNRDWFAENKHRYLSAQQNVLDFVQDLIENIGEFDEKIARMDAKRSLFRIYRDVRFSLDKSPYKTNFGAGLGMGKGSNITGYYLHIEPGKSFLAAGAYHPQPADLKKIRTEISENAEIFRSIINSEDFIKNFKKLDEEEKLKKVPQGFDKDDKMAEFIKLKNFIAVKNLTDAEILSQPAEEISKIYKSAKPLNDFLENPFK